MPEQEPINYSKSKATDPVAQLMERMDTGEVTLEWEPRHGYLTSLMQHLDVRASSQTLLLNEEVSEKLEVESGANLTDLSSRFDVKPYLTAHSDLVALMVLEHQAMMHNVLTAANHSGRITARDAVIMNKALERPEGFESESTARRYASASENVVKALLFSGAVPLLDPVAGTSAFAEEFSARGPIDSKGRSLRRFDLKTRLFVHPCSFLIHSESFCQLPDGVKNRVWQRLDEILLGRDSSGKFAHLSSDDRVAVREILSETCADAPWALQAAWNQ